MQADASPAIELRGISKRYDTFQAVHPMDMSIARGSTYGLLGPNGAGKTTTIRMILRILEPDTGEIRLLGKPQSQEGLDRIGYLPEERGVYRRMTVRSLLSFFAELKGIKPRDSKPIIDTWLERMDLAGRRDAKLQELSKGMQQKVQFISAILHDPEVVILDEPFSGLDPLNQRVLREIISELRGKGRTIVFSTHIIEHAERICDSVGIIARGAKVADGTIAEVKAAAGGEYVAIRLDEWTGDAVAALRKLPHVREVREHGKDLEVGMRSEADPQDLLNFLVSNGMRLRRFEVTEPSLEQIFIDRVAAREAELGQEAAHV
jgi:ABC-2 type transport system ATP-binding protein